MRQTTVEQVGRTLSIISKLPMRQTTRIIALKSKYPFSKLPMRQTTVGKRTTIRHTY